MKRPLSITEVLDREAAEMRRSFTVDELMVRWHVSRRRVMELLQPHRGKCHLARRGRNFRLYLYAPVDVVFLLDREREEVIRRPA